MKFEIARMLVCPQCSSKLDLYPFQVENEEVKDGIFKCTGCERFYLIVNFIPRMLLPTLYHNDRFIERYMEDLHSSGVKVKNRPTINQDPLNKLKNQTIKKFGFEWLEYGRFGWDDSVFNIEREEGVFSKKSLLNLKDLQGKLVLDAGCGNGRYSYWGAKYGAQVIGVDLGSGVESAYKNTKDIENIHIIQGDLFNLPFPEESFDVIFSIGVLMHTGNAKLATKSLTDHLKKDGIITVHMYHKGNIIYEFNDFWIRKYTTKLSIEQLISFTRKMHAIAKVLGGLKLLRYINAFIRLENHPHCIFDWYSAPVATHHNYKEVYEWFDEFGLQVIKDNKVGGGSLLRKLMRKLYPPGSLTVSGVRVR